MKPSIGVRVIVAVLFVAMLATPAVIKQVSARQEEAQAIGRAARGIRASAVMCSECRTPSSSRMGKRCNREGWQEERTDSIWAADVTFV